MLGALRKVSLAPERSNPCRAFPVSGVRYERDHPRQHVPELWAQRDGRGWAAPLPRARSLSRSIRARTTGSADGESNHLLPNGC